MRTRIPQGEEATLPIVEKEIASQPFRLQEALGSLRVRAARRHSILIGAGDSFAASICVSSLSPLELTPADPLELAARPDIAEQKDVYFISVSGTTRSNIDAAKKVKERSRRSIAVTCDPNSPLAAQCDEVITIPFSPRRKSPGILSFSLSLLAGLKLGSCCHPCDFNSAMSEAMENVELVRLAEGGTSYFLGSGAMYGVSIYASAKLYEFLGWRAHGERLEEFSHMELFSLEAPDSVNILSGRDDYATAERLQKALWEHGFVSSLLKLRGRTDMEKTYAAAFAVQLASLRAARQSGLTSPYFLGARDKLRISDSMIY